MNCFIIYLSDSSLPCRLAAQRQCCTARQNAGSWLADTWDSPAGPYDVCCHLIGGSSAASWSRECWDEHGEWRTLCVCAWSTVWAAEDRLWIQQHCAGLFTYLLTYLQTGHVTWDILRGSDWSRPNGDRQSVSRGIDQLRRGTMARVRVKRSEVKVWVMMRIELGHCCSIHTVLTVWCVDYM